MFVYEKRLQYPVKIANTNPRLASLIISQYGGPDGELGASLRYLSQRYSMPYPELKGLLTDIGTDASKRTRIGASSVLDFSEKLDFEFDFCLSFSSFQVFHHFLMNPAFSNF